MDVALEFGLRQGEQLGEREVAGPRHLTMEREVPCLGRQAGRDRTRVENRPVADQHLTGRQGRRHGSELAVPPTYGRDRRILT